MNLELNYHLKSIFNFDSDDLQRYLTTPKRKKAQIRKAKQSKLNKQNG
jgi:hypothetical protein